MKFSSIAALWLLCAAPVWAGQEAASDALYAEDFSAAAQFQRALKEGDKEAVAALIDYPLARQFPLTYIASAAEFVAHWDEYVDATTTAQWVGATPEVIGWRGVQLYHGSVWFAGGKISALHGATPAYKKAWEDAKIEEEKGLYVALHGYDQVGTECHTPSAQIRTQLHGEDWRYFEWKKGAPRSAKPQRELHQGVMQPEGSGGNYTLLFKDGTRDYQLQMWHFVCGEDCHNYLAVHEAGKEIHREICQ